MSSDIKLACNNIWNTYMCLRILCHKNLCFLDNYFDNMYELKIHKHVRILHIHRYVSIPGKPLIEMLINGIHTGHLPYDFTSYTPSQITNNLETVTVLTRDQKQLVTGPNIWPGRYAWRNSMRKNYLHCMYSYLHLRLTCNYIFQSK